MPVVELTKKLIACASVSPKEGGCHDLIKQRLTAVGFTVEELPFEDESTNTVVDNLWIRKGKAAPLFVFAGHSDVVPPGPAEAWTSPPFQPTEREGYLYGRGATDMKSGLAAMIVAAEDFLAKHPNHAGSIAFLITSDEEAKSTHGTKKVMEELERRGEKINYCIVGEASSEKLLGDQIRVGRRGSLHGHLRVHGKQGHIAYPVEGQNPIHKVAPALAKMTATTWDQGNEFFPPTSFQISNIHAGTGAFNVVPGSVTVDFNFRFSTAVTAEDLQQRVKEILEAQALKYDLTWDLSGQPFLTGQGKLLEAVRAALKETCGQDPELSTAGGTSDGRFIALTGAEVIELGPLHASAHQVNERIKLSDLEQLPEVYARILEKLLG